MKEINLGYTSGESFRENNKYNRTQSLFEKLGLSNEVENNTPTVGVNIAHLAKMKSVQKLADEFVGKELSVAILGISTAEGPRDLQRLLKGLGATRLTTTAFDINNGIFESVMSLSLDRTICFQKDARKTGLPNNSQNLVLRDHLGNCCPPEINWAIDQEVTRILKPGGISLVNITTSELLTDSEERQIIDLKSFEQVVDRSVIEALQESIYDIDGLFKTFPQSLDWERLKGPIIEIESDSYVVFGEDSQGHGEWFRLLTDHLNSWQENGLKIIDIKTRQGLDSHNPPLTCLRHNVVLKKI